MLVHHKGSSRAKGRPLDHIGGGFFDRCSKDNSTCTFKIPSRLWTHGSQGQALANDASTMSDLDALHNGNDKGDGQPDLKAPTVPIISIPTSLSGGEYVSTASASPEAVPPSDLYHFLRTTTAAAQTTPPTANTASAAPSRVPRS